MPRPRLPAEQLAARGTFDHDPKRAEGRNSPKPTEPLGEPPESLPEPVKQAWREITEHAPEGLLTIADFVSVRSAARLLARENDGQITPQERRQLTDLLREFGMTPKARNYVSVPQPPKYNPFAEFAARP